MPRFRVTLYEEAERNVEAIHTWIAGHSAEGAARWYVAFNEKLEELGRDAERFPVAPESHHFDRTIRDATFHTRAGRTYRVLFAISAEDVAVLFVRGPGQDSATP